MNTKPNRGHFRPGPDPRRHVLTTEERRRGFHVALTRSNKTVRRWLVARVRATARPETVAAFDRALQRRYERAMSDFN